MQVKDAQLMYDKETKRHRGNVMSLVTCIVCTFTIFVSFKGFGFVTFETEEAVDEVCSIQYHDIRNKKVTSYSMLCVQLLEPFSG